MSTDVDRIAIYIPSFGRGGVERFVLNLSAHLVKRDVAVDVLTFETSSKIDQLADGVRCLSLDRSSFLATVGSRFPAHVRNAIASFPAYVRYLRWTDPSLLVSTQTSPFAVLGARLARTSATVAVRESNTPSVATRDPSHRTGEISPLAKRIVYPRADAVVAVSNDAADDIAQWLGLDRESVTTIYNPTYTFDLLDRAKEPVDHPWLADESVPVITSVGRFSDQKDFETLVRAFALVLEQRSVRLLLVGDGDNKENLESLCSELGISDSVDFVGYKSNPHKYVSRADVFVLSSRYEGLPNALVEAVGVGTPSIATDCPSGPREVLLDGDGGLLVPVGDTDAMATAIHTYLDDPETATRHLATAGDALNRFSPERAADAYLQLAAGNTPDR